MWEGVRGCEGVGVCERTGEGGSVCGRVGEDVRV